MSKIFIILLTFIINSCAQIDFVYEDEKNLINPLYEKVIVNVTGLELVYINSYVPVFFGNKSCLQYILQSYFAACRQPLSFPTKLKKLKIS